MYIIGILAGVLLPVQTSLNSKFRFKVGSPYLAAMVAFIMAAVFLGLITVLQGRTLGVRPVLWTTQPWWIWIGGLLGIVGGTIPIILFPHLGSVQTVVIPIFGQVVMSMLIDNFGWFASPVFKFNGWRFIGVFVLLMGLWLVIAVRNSQQPAHNRQWFWQVLGLIAGAALASQAAVNGRLGAVLHSPVHAAFSSFLTGTVVLALGVTLWERDLSHLRNGFGHGKPWWIWFGGLLGGLYVLGNSFLAPLIGTGATVVVVLLGNIFGGLLIDQWGLLGAKQKSITLRKSCGLVLMLIGVTLVKFF